MRAFLIFVVGFLWAGAGHAQVEAANPEWNTLLQTGLLWGGAPLLAAALVLWFEILVRRPLSKSVREEPEDLRVVGRWSALVAAGVLAVILIITAGTAYYTASKLKHDAWLRYQFEADRVEDGLQRQFESLLPALRGIRGASAIGVTFKRDELRRWVAGRDRDQEFPGVVGLGVVDFTINPSRARQLTERGNLSFEPAEFAPSLAAISWGIGGPLHESLQRAVQSGRAVLTGAVPIVRNDASVQALVYAMPVYSGVGVPLTESQRMEKIQSFAFAVVHLNDFLAGLDSASRGMIAFELRDSLDEDNARLVFHSDRLTDANFTPMFDESRNVLLGQRFFQLRVVTTPEFGRTLDADLVGYIAFGGSLVGVSFALVAWLLMVGRARALARASALSRDVERLALVAERTSNAVVITDPHERITWVNDGFTRITGYALDEVKGKKPNEFLQSPHTSPESRAILRKALDRGNACRARILNVGKSGHEYWLDVEIQPQHDRSGRLVGFMAIEQDVTEQVAAEEALAREKERADGILLGSNVGTWQTNMLTGQTLVNTQWSRMMGFEPEEVGPDLAAFWVSRVRPEDLARVNNLLELCRAGASERYEADLRVRHKNGQWIWIMSRAVVLSRDVQGHPEWIAGIHMDVTEQRKTEEGLRDLQAFLYRSGRAAGVGAWEIDIHTGIIKWSEQTCEIHGVEHGYQPSREEALSFYNEEDRRTLLAAMERAPETLMGWDLTMPFTSREGDAKWVRIVGEVEFDDSGPVRLVGAFQDVTVHKAAEAELLKTGAVLQSVLDSAVQVAVIASNLDRVITVFNKGAEQMLGYQAEELVQRETTSKLFALEQLTAIKEVLALELGHAPNADEVFTYVVEHKELNEWTFVRKDQTRLTVSFLISTMYDHAGQAVGYLGIAHDITLQKQQELNLREAKAQAEAANVAKSQFLANMSHEIRTPMNAILGMLRLLQNTPMSSQQNDYTQKTLGAAKSLLGLLNDILDFSKVEAGKLQLDPHPFLLEDLLADMSVILSSNLAGKPVDLVFDIDPALPRQVLGDALRIKQVLINLGGNAVKFTAQGHVSLVWTCSGRSGNRVRTRLEVRDTGIGIAAENQKHIFDGFTQAEANTTRKYGGTGLGLAISQRLIRLLGSELTLESTPGVGSTFAFELELPVVTDDMDSADTNTVSELRVLVVDDDPVSQAAIAKAAGSLGWQVVCADTAEQALQYVERANAGQDPHIDVMFIDDRMPEADGWQLLSSLQSGRVPGPLPRCILLARTGPELLDTKLQVLNQSLDGYLVKPLTAGMLERAVSQAMRKEAGSRVDSVPAPAAGQRLLGMRILVVEDNPINRQVARELLTAEGAHVQLAENGQLGVDALRAQPQGFDVVLMDLQMPVLDGLAAAGQIRGPLGLHALPVIAMTANAMESDRKDCLDAGMNDHIGKPFDLNHLVQTLNRWTGRTRDAAAPVQASSQAASPVAQASLAGAWTGAVDTDAAVKRMGGNQHLYGETLKAYLAEATAISGQVRAALRDGDYPMAQRQVHAFKGLSATVGASDLQQLALVLESALKRTGGRDSVDEAVMQLESGVLRLMPVLKMLSEQMGHGASGSEGLAEEVDIAPWLALCQLLKNEDMEALTAHAELVQTVPSTLQGAMEPLSQAISDLDFAKAEAECTRLIKRFKG